MKWEKLKNKGIHRGWKKWFRGIEVVRVIIRKKRNTGCIEELIYLFKLFNLINL